MPGSPLMPVASKSPVALLAPPVLTADTPPSDTGAESFRQKRCRCCTFEADGIEVASGCGCTVDADAEASPVTLTWCQVPIPPAWLWIGCLEH